MYNFNINKSSRLTLVTFAVAILLVAGLSITNAFALDLTNLAKVDDFGQSVECVIAVVGCDGTGSVDSSGDTIIGSNNGNNNTNGGGEESISPPTLIVKKMVTCESETPVSCEDLDSNFEPQDFIITVSGQNPNPSQFGGSSSGTEVGLEPGSYEVTEDISGVDGRIVVEDDNGTIISGNFINVLDAQITYSEGCSGTIETGETKTCTITNPIRLLD